MDKVIYRLTLDFPNGISVDTAQKYSQLIDVLDESSVSQGGFTMLSNPYFDEPMEFSDNEMNFVYGYKKMTKEERENLKHQLERREEINE